MADLIIKTTGEVLLGDMEVARITFTKPFCEADVAGEYVSEGYASDGWGSEDECDDLEHQLGQVEAAAKIAKLALFDAQRLVLRVLPKLNWRAAELNAEDVTLLNEVPIQIETAIKRLAEVL